MYNLINLMKLIIDNREKDLIPIIQNIIDKTKQYKDIIQLETRQLPLGDIIFLDDDDNEVIIIERKTVNDLASSIKDGRYNEQSLRLSYNSLHNHNIIYLIEGKIQDVNSKFTKITPDIIYSSLCSILYHKGFSILRSFDIQETATIILRFYNKILKENKREAYYNDKSKYMVTNNEVMQNGHLNINDHDPDNNTTNTGNINGGSGDNNNIKNEYISAIKTIKKDNITPDNISIIMLSQIPGISTITSIAIMDKYKTISRLIDALKENNDCLKDIKYTTKTGKVRRINKTSISSINKFLI